MNGDADLAWERRLVEMRRRLHEQPEIAHEEYATTEAIRGWLLEAGIRIADYPLPTGVIAEVGERRDGPIVAVRADIDALPIQEATGLPFASKRPGFMHACGHDFHTAAALGAALLLKERESELAGVVRFLFQPAEEKASGAKLVIESGALADVQAVFGLHNKPDLPVGTVGVIAGPIMAAADGFTVEVTGLGSHAATPEAGRDPIVSAAHIVTALQSIISRDLSSLDSAVLSVTRFHAGTAWNVIPDRAAFDGTIRTLDESVRAHVLKKFEQVVRGVAEAYGTPTEVKWIPGPPPVRNDAAWAEQVKRTAERLGLVVVAPRPSPASEDFAFYLQQTPGAYFFLGVSGPHEWHHPSFDTDERALPIAAKLLSAVAADAIAGLAVEDHKHGKRGR